MASAKPNQKPIEKPPLPPSFLERVLNGIDTLLKEMFSLEKGWYKELGFVKNNYKLGVNCYQKGELRDAIFRLKLVVWFEPTHASAWYYLGRAYADNGKLVLAQQAFRQVLKLKPDGEEAAYINALGRGKNTDNIPAV